LPNRMFSICNAATTFLFTLGQPRPPPAQHAAVTTPARLTAAIEATNKIKITYWLAFYI
jgi:hypothetical protein